MAEISVSHRTLVDRCQLTNPGLILALDEKDPANVTQLAHYII